MYKKYKEYGLGKASIFNTAKKFNIKLLSKEFRPYRISKIEDTIASILSINNINFARQKYINNCKWNVDFLLENNKVIEVYGDYWHANPKMCNYEKLHTSQKNNLLKDIVRNQWLKENGYQILEIWEYDIKKNIDQVKLNIINYAQKNVV